MNIGLHHIGFRSWNSSKKVTLPSIKTMKSLISASTPSERLKSTRSQPNNSIAKPNRDKKFKAPCAPKRDKNEAESRIATINTSKTVNPEPV